MSSVTGTVDVKTLNEVYDSFKTVVEFDNFNKNTLWSAKYISNSGAEENGYAITSPVTVIFADGTDASVFVISLQKDGVCLFPFGYRGRNELKEKSPFKERENLTDLIDVDSLKRNLRVWTPNFSDKITSDFIVSFPNWFFDGSDLGDNIINDDNYDIGLSTVITEKGKTPATKMKGLMLKDLNERTKNVENPANTIFSNGIVTWSDNPFAFMCLYGRKPRVDGKSFKEAQNLYLQISQDGYYLEDGFGYKKTSGYHKVNVPRLTMLLKQYEGTTPAELIKDPLFEESTPVISNFIEGEPASSSSSSGSGGGSSGSTGGGSSQGGSSTTPAKKTPSPQKQMPPKEIPKEKNSGDYLNYLANQIEEKYNQIAKIKNEMRSIRISDEKYDKKRLEYQKEIKKVEEEIQEMENEIVLIYEKIAISDD